MLEVDPLAAMRMWAVDTSLHGERLHIPALPAADWLPALMSNDLTRVLDLADEDPTVNLLASGELTVQELADTLRDAVAAVTGRSAHVALNIAVTAGARWDVVGRHVARTGVRFDRIPVGMALDLLYDCILNNLDENGQQLFHRQLQEPMTKGQARTRFTALAGKPVPPANAEQYANVRPKTRRRSSPPPPVDPNGGPTPPPAVPAPDAPARRILRASGRMSPDRLEERQQPEPLSDGPGVPLDSLP